MATPCSFPCWHRLTSCQKSQGSLRSGTAPRQLAQSSLPSRKEAVHATALTELYQIAHAGNKAAPCGYLLCQASPPGQLPLLSDWSVAGGNSPTPRIERRTHTHPLFLQSSRTFATSLQLQLMLSKRSQLGTASITLTTSMAACCCCGCSGPTGHSPALPVPMLQSVCPAAAGNCWQALRQACAVQ